LPLNHRNAIVPLTCDIKSSLNRGMMGMIEMKFPFAGSPWAQRARGHDCALRTRRFRGRMWDGAPLGLRSPVAWRDASTEAAAEWREDRRHRPSHLTARTRYIGLRTGALLVDSAK
jgi:hypothetical protein